MTPQPPPGGGSGGDARSVPIPVSVCSWNVGQSAPPPLDELRQWLRPAALPCPRVLAVGLQEVDMTAMAMVKEATSARKQWLISLQAAAGDTKLVCIGARQLVGLLLAVFVDPALGVTAADVCMEVVRCGKGGRVGNKGAVGASLNLGGTRLCLVNVHFAAHMQHCQKRNEDFARIVRTMSWTTGGRRLGVRDHDAAFLFGDLNYRIEMKMEDCIQRVRQGDWKYLLGRDQLLGQMRSALQRDSSLCDWRDTLEVVPTFAPSYKYVPGSGEYDAEPGGKRRTPSWCDRVLWWTRLPAPPWPEAIPTGGALPADVVPGTCRLHRFDRAELLHSDHRPVAARFSVWALPPAQQPSERPRSPQSPQLGGAGAALANAVARVSIADCSVDEAPDLVAPEDAEAAVAQIRLRASTGRKRSGAIVRGVSPLMPRADWSAGSDMSGDEAAQDGEDGTNSATSGSDDDDDILLRTMRTGPSCVTSPDNSPCLGSPGGAHFAASGSPLLSQTRPRASGSAPQIRGPTSPIPDERARARSLIPPRQLRRTRTPPPRPGGACGLIAAAGLSFLERRRAGTPVPGEAMGRRSSCPPQPPQSDCWSV
eukprot:TRINITY_DN25117_c0_g1_i1.p1 TRINITY_DN25117_c0_g1~~TRINITY_DN25117_c0_g1_i1.p1  ORF type:complete len:646 (+),score=153.04 TRINITY_DN25117_c0_g1_i1:157-1938(+)